ncbi:MAG: dodecin domain-containing protein [Gemmatimonadota bacterium]
MAEPFTTPASSDGGMLDRISGRRHKLSVARELEALLAGAERIEEITPAEVDGIGERHGVDLTARLRTVRKVLYRRFLEHCLLDCRLSSRERDQLVHLRHLLHLDGEDAGRVHDQVAQVVYGDAMERVLEDHHLDPEEEEFLRCLRDDLQLSSDAAARLRAEAERRARARFVARAAVHDHAVVAPRETVLEFEGASSRSIEEAIEAALTEACRAVPGLCAAQVIEVYAELATGRVAGWRVRVRSALPRH